MQTIPQLVNEIIKSSPYLESALAEGIINQSALARKLAPQISKQLVKPVSEASVLMALKRLQPKLKINDIRLDKILALIHEITVKSDLIELTIINNDESAKLLAEVSGQINLKENDFYSISRGVRETGLIFSAGLYKTIRNLLKPELISMEQKDLAVVNIKLPEVNVETPGLYYQLLKKLAWEGINLIEVVSTRNEINLFVGEVDLNEAFRVINQLRKSLNN